MHGRELRKLFAEFNRRYFGNRLPQYRIRVGGCWMRESGVCIREKKLIRLTRGQPDDQLISSSCMRWRTLLPLALWHGVSTSSVWRGLYNQGSVKPTRKSRADCMSGLVS